MSPQAGKFPPWLKKRVPCAGGLAPVRDLLEELNLATVCQEAHCPNLGECFARGVATFMILGRVCSRQCRFCAVRKGQPEPVDPDEPERVAEAVSRMGLKHVVVTSVTRDDLPDGGSGHFADTVRAIHERSDATVEVLTPDFVGRAEDIERVVSAGPEVYNHNVETVPRLYAEVRPQADYARSLGVLNQAAGHGLIAKSGLMLGLGETPAEVEQVLRDLRGVGCAAVTLGQYLAPSPRHHPVAEFVTPEQFDRCAEFARSAGFEDVASGPFVRSSYAADRMAERMIKRRKEWSTR